MDPNEYVLMISDLAVDYETDNGVVKAVDGVTLSLKKGSVLGLVGETGAGKTTTARAIMNIVPNPPGVIKRGKVWVCGEDVFAMDKRRLHHMRGNMVSMVFQDPMTSLNPVLTVGDQISEVIQVHNKLMDRREVEKKTAEMLEMVGIPANRASDYPHQFSGGMKQRVVLAMAIACTPQLLIADEPTTALDVTIQAQVLDIIRDLQKQIGMSMLLITHDLGIIAEMCDEVAVMYAGAIVEQGTLEDVFEHTAHPYTEGLFNSLPNITNRKSWLKPIPGLMPDPTNLPAGCAFAPRCQYAGEDCLRERPKMRQVGDTHYVACFGYDRDGFTLEGRE